MRNQQSLPVFSRERAGIERNSDTQLISDFMRAIMVMMGPGMASTLQQPTVANTMMLDPMMTASLLRPLISIRRLM